VSGSDSGAAPDVPGPGRTVGSETQPEAVPGEAAGSAGGEQPAAFEPPGTAGSGTTAGPGATAGSGAAAGSAGDGAAGSDADSGAGEPTTRGRRKGRKHSFWRELPILIAIALVLAVVIKTYFIQAFWIPSGSMENTLEINDRVLVNKVIYHIRGIDRGDIVVFNGDGSWDPGSVPASGNIFEQFADGFASMFGFGHPGDILIKRVIGLPGDRVACCDAAGRVTVNGVPLNEQSYLYPGSAPSEIRFNIVVPRGRLWVMGDNRFYSDDSRDHQGDPGNGTIPESAVIGRAFVIIWPISRWQFLPIPATFHQAGLSALAGPAAGGAGPAGPASGPLPGSARLEPGSPAVPLALGFAGAIPLTWLQHGIRMRARRRRSLGPGRPARFRSGLPGSGVCRPDPGRSVSWRRLAVRADARQQAR
jgi:signal peptidase I